eukprot:TRINITY_DN47170_c0_g1_i1.p1 TRINITY_DN47170_c0_g1~~TRINITY_DN47170_c0_g1_i1.p1  ORF type:complete len:696 (+),score=167.85 TRINITY_DN47170_c0_g1_i1:44-2089(+)
MAKKKKRQGDSSTAPSGAAALPTASDAATGDVAMALKAVQWLTAPDSKKKAKDLFEALMEATKPLVLLRAAKYEVDAQAAKIAEAAAGNPANARAGAGAASNAASRKRALEEPPPIAACELSSKEVARSVRALRSLASQPEELLSKACKPLRAALHPLVESHLREEKSSPAFRVTSMLGQRVRWPEALKVLHEFRNAEASKRPKLGAYQRWVRELNVAEGNPTELLMLDAIMRVAAGLPPCIGKRPEEGRLNLIQPWRPKLVAASSETGQLAKVKESSPETQQGQTSTANKLFSLIAKRKGEAASKTSAVAAGGSFQPGSWRVLAHEVGSERVPPNHYDLDIFMCSPTVLPLDVTPSRPTQRHDVPGVTGAFVLSDVLSHDECHALRQATEAMGYRPDVPLSSQLDERAHNVVLMATEAQNESLFQRVKTLLPQEIGRDKLQGINRRWRLYRYLSGNLYRKHLDGAWPASGISMGATGQEEYVYDAFGGGTRSKLTFIVYLNDDCEGGCTTFFVPNPGEEGTLDARPVQPRMGSATVFPHGDTGVPLLHEGSSVTSGTKYLLRTDVVYASPETSEELKQEARRRGLARQLGILGGKGLVEKEQDAADSVKSGKAGKKKRVIKPGLKDKKQKGQKGGEGSAAGEAGAGGKKKGKKFGKGQPVGSGFGKKIKGKKRGSMAKRR